MNRQEFITQTEAAKVIGCSLDTLKRNHLRPRWPSRVRLYGQIKGVFKYRLADCIKTRDWLATQRDPNLPPAPTAEDSCPRCGLKVVVLQCELDKGQARCVTCGALYVIATGHLAENGHLPLDGRTDLPMDAYRLSEDDLKKLRARRWNGQPLRGRAHQP